MRLGKTWKKLRKNKKLSRWPPVWLPFIFVILLLGEAYVFPFEKYKLPLYSSAIFALFYAIAHWNYIRILNRKS
ncbi:MAG: hypothetical protein KKF50_02810 [Nanoarchaeota archaeon]|nr:hypothetical protein [Nanoarchaeota archaeon]